MNIPSIPTGAMTNAATAAKTAAATAKVTENAKNQEEDVKQTTTKQDEYVKTGDSSKTSAYEEPKRLTANELKEISDQRMSSFQNMLKSMITKQGEKSNLALFGSNFTISPTDSENAASAIADGGPWSVDAVATRIMDMAHALSGGDESKASVLRDAVKKGFDAAGVAWGDELPGICQDTYKEVMKRFDEWENKSSASDTTVE